MKMYRIIAAVSFITAVFLAVSCNGNRQEKSAPAGEASLVEVKIEGMTCTGCEQTIQRNIGKLEGIKSVKASFTTGTAVIEYFPGTVDTLKMKEAVKGSGYIVKKFIPSNP